MRSRVQELFHAVVDLSAEARKRYFAENGVGANTQREVEVLIPFDSAETGSLENDIGEVALGAIAQVEAQNIQCGPYRLDAVLGRGGMGTVYRAERVDGEVSQRVAVKLLRSGADDRRFHSRFLAERQILASLSHPNVAKLLDAGHREDGQPYLVMEYVEGHPIDVYTAGFTVRRKLGLFLKVCAAVSYLHRNLVVHRDLKPANILVTREGEPIVLDFGIAKILEGATGSAATSMLIVTPDYASPEQVSGSPITTATDIYSLGATLYKLLTGASPHQFDTQSPAGVAMAISAGRIPQPSKLAPGLKGDLEAVLMKALRKEPNERYATIDQFADDLANYLDLRPIRARADDGWYRTRKFMRRHWLPASAALFAIASLSGGVLVANHQRAIAQRRFVQVRQLSNKLFDIDNEVQKTPGTTKARELIVTTSLEYLRRLNEDVGSNSQLAFELGNAYLQVARVQGVPIGLNLGHADEADRSLQTAERLMASVLRSQPRNRTALARSAQIAHDRMIVAVLKNRHEDVFRFARTSEAFLSKYESSGRVDPAEAEEVIRTYSNISNCYAGENQWGEVIRLSRYATDLALAAGLYNRAGAALTNMAKALHGNGDLENALKTSREAAHLLESPAGMSKSARILALVAALVREGEILGDGDTVSLGREIDAVAPLRRAYAITEDLIRQDPSDSESRIRLPNATLPLAYVLRERDPRQALSLYDHTLSRLAELGDNPRARRKEAWVLAASTYALRRLGRKAEALRRLNAAMARLNDLKLYPNGELGSESLETLCAMADYEAVIGSSSRAIELYKELLGRIETLKPGAHAGLFTAVDMNRIYVAYASLYRRRGRPDLAIAVETRRLELWRYWRAKLPNSDFVRRQIEAASESAG